MIATSPATRRLRVIDPVADARWDAFTESHQSATIFHTAAWTRVLIDAYGYTPRYHVLEEDGEIQAAWPAMYVNSRLTGRRLVTIPFSDHCGPLIRTSEDAQALLGALLADAHELQAKRIECRGWPEGVEIPNALIPVRGYVQHVLDLRPGADALLSRVEKNARRSLQRARKEGVATRVVESKADFNTFIDLNLKLRRSHGMLPQPRRFFEAIDRYCLQPGLGYILLAERNRLPLAALLLLRHNDVTLDKFAVNDSAYREYRGSHCAMWAAIEIEARRGTKRYNMGRSDASAKSLHWFKEQWGAVAVDASYYYHPKPGGQSTEDPRGVKKATLSAFARYAPNPIFSAAGALVYRHLG